MAINHIIPTAVKYQSSLINNVEGLKKILDSKDFDKAAKDNIETIKEIGSHCSSIRAKVEAMRKERAKANEIEDAEKAAMAYANKVKPFFEEIRSHIDNLEMIVDNELWPLPKYRELLFFR